MIVGKKYSKGGVAITIRPLTDENKSKKSSFGGSSISSRNFSNRHKL